MAEFYNIDRVGFDMTQRNTLNVRAANYITDNLFSGNLSDAHVQFATSAPNVMFKGSLGSGLPGDAVDTDTRLVIQSGQNRSLEKLQLNQRPFLTVPYLGRGAINPDVETQLKLGQNSSEKKSVMPIVENTNNDEYPMDDGLRERIGNPAYSVEEAALAGWVRGGKTTRIV
jgi:hypothetical protein